MYVQAAPLGFSLNPLHYAKKAVHEAAAGGKFVVHHAGDIAKLAVLPVVEMNKYILQPILHVALTPVRRKVDVLKNRRAHKIAWDTRKSPTPTPAENAQAKSWAKSYLKHEVPPFGLMLSLLAGPALYGAPRANMFGTSAMFGDPTTATIIASVPTLLAIIDKVLTRSDKNGQAPSNAAGKGKGGGGGGGGGAAAADGGGAAADAGGGADAGADASAAGGDDGGADAGGGGGGRHGGKHGGGGGGAGTLAKKFGLSKKQLMIGGAVVGGLVLLVLLMPKKS
jgi:hypothetical protein